MERPLGKATKQMIFLTAREKLLMVTRGPGISDAQLPWENKLASFFGWSPLTGRPSPKKKGNKGPESQRVQVPSKEVLRPLVTPQKPSS